MYPKLLQRMQVCRNIEHAALGYHSLASELQSPVSPSKLTLNVYPCMGKYGAEQKTQFLPVSQPLPVKAIIFHVFGFLF